MQSPVLLDLSHFFAFQGEVTPDQGADEKTNLFHQQAKRPKVQKTFLFWGEEFSYYENNIKK